MMKDKANIDCTTKGNGVLPCVSTRTWAFKGFNNGIPFEIPITAEDRETAIAHFETDNPDLSWNITIETN